MSATTRHCPVCRRPIPPAEATARHAPFCSPRCAEVDLGRWFTGQYRVPVRDDEDAGGEGVDPADGSR